jgi:hypothetical protein
MGIRLVGLVCVLVLLGCRSKSADVDAGAIVNINLNPIPTELASALAGANINSATGHVESTGSTGAWTFDSGTCHSGDNNGYFGVIAKSNADKRVWIKLVKDPIKQWTLGVSIPDTCKAGANGQECTVQYFDQDNACTKLDVGFKTYTFQGRRTGGGHQFDGTATFDCKTSTSHVSGTLTVEKCSP